MSPRIPPRLECSIACFHLLLNDAAWDVVVLQVCTQAGEDHDEESSVGDSGCGRER
jgi:hypothetical protein